MCRESVPGSKTCKSTSLASWSQVSVTVKAAGVAVHFIVSLRKPAQLEKVFSSVANITTSLSPFSSGTSLENTPSTTAAVYFWLSTKINVEVIVSAPPVIVPVSYTHLRAHETDSYLVCRLLLEKKKK